MVINSKDKIVYGVAGGDITVDSLTKETCSTVQISVLDTDVLLNFLVTIGYVSLFFIGFSVLEQTWSVIFILT